MFTTSSASTPAPRPPTRTTSESQSLFGEEVESIPVENPHNKALKEEQLQMYGIILRRRILMGKLRPNATTMEDLWLEQVHQGRLI